MPEHLVKVKSKTLNMPYSYCMFNDAVFWDHLNPDKSVILDIGKSKDILILANKMKEICFHLYGTSEDSHLLFIILGLNLIDFEVFLYY